MGGSFNPPHLGHLALAQEARRRMNLHQVWWLVSPQNPLKSKSDMLPFQQRLALCKLMAEGHPWLIASDLEARQGTRYSFDTMARLKARFPHLDMFWLMGADNLATAHRWRRWHDFFNTVPMVIFMRPDVPSQGLKSPAAVTFAALRQSANSQAPHGWRLMTQKKLPISATQIRKALARGQRPAGVADARVLRALQLKNPKHQPKISGGRIA